jgi:uncharacterized membrane protein YbhN (UPF0104 family)
VARGALGWQLALSVLLTIIVIALVWRDRAWLSSALGLVRSADLLLVGSALAMILLSYLVSSQIFRVGLRAYGRRVSVIRLWATTITGVVISQSFPAGGVGTYAFFVSSFKAIGIDAHQAAALAALEALSYVGALLLIGMFSIVYLAAHTIGGEAALSLAGPLSAVVVAAVVLGGAVFAITRSEATLTRLAVGVTRGVQRALRRPQSDATGQALAATLVRGRELIVSHRGTALTMVLIQVVALIGHSLGLLLALRSLHAVAPFPIVLTALGIGLMTSTFNVLPGGGGTVETALVAVLLHFGVGDAAAPGAILFRLLDFWAMLPLAIVCYGWLRRARR